MADEQGKKKVDEEWKKKVKEDAEKAEQQADASAKSSESGAKTESSEGEEAAPSEFEANFQMLVTNFAIEALISMGAMENPATKKRSVNLGHAKYAIDMLQVIADKTKGNLSDEEKKALDGTLYDLRMRYLQVT